ncbi:MAG: isoleucine--tRNA ligase [Alphaproteobacteria bacterium]|nr:isoleucine--tRNA ligase [Alphaproteobacteria bacterium]
MTKYYPDVDSSPSFPKIEEEVLRFWKEQKVFEKSVESRPRKTPEGGKNEFIFYDGPPFANGLPHYGHLLTGFVKDLVARYQTMKGKRVERRFGWDCHGLPAEMGAEKELGISGRQQITKYGIDKFNDHCRTSVMKYVNEWEYYVTRQARWVDFQNDYKTMDTSFTESVLWAFKQLYEKGLVYEAMRVLPYSWAAETPLSNFETRLDNSYRMRQDPAVTVAFTLKKEDVEAKFPQLQKCGFSKYSILAWTTTPWTLPSNLGLAVSESIKYQFIRKTGTTECVLFSEKIYDSGKYEKEIGDYKNDQQLPIDGGTVSGQQLIGLPFEPLFPYFKDHANAFQILDGSDFVSDEDGTGVVHMAPGFGEDDQRVCEANGIALVVPVDHAGRFTSEIFDLEDLKLQGVRVLAEGDHPFGEANKRIMDWLKKHGALIKQETIDHNYPHCWRTDQPLIYRAMSSWYVEVTKFRDRMVELNQQINWIPEHVKAGLFGKWLEGARDWSISRNRFWGAPVPIWRSDNPKNKKLYVFGSIKELQEFFKVEVKDLHRPYIDQLTAPDPEDGQYTLRRVEDVLDCWFESGSMPYGQVHYPFEHEDWFVNHSPADFIVEYTAQTRGWFYTLMVLSTALFDKPPFLNCICHGVVLDDKGQKLSKRLNNYADPKELFDHFGADALRWFMVASPVMRGLELHIDKEGKFIRDVVRLAIKPIWNAYNFFCLYANADGVKASYGSGSYNLMDRYILAKLRDAVEKVEAFMDAYDTPSACTEILSFCDSLNNWYIRRNRARFWKGEMDSDKQAAYDTLYTVLDILCRTASPLLPLTLEEIYAGLTNSGQKTADNSVHVALWPDVMPLPKDANLVADMDKVREVCTAVLSVRNTKNLRVRLPLASVTVIGADTVRLREYAALIQDEVNVKEVHFSTRLEEFATLKLQLNLPKLGARLGAKLKQIMPAVKQNQWKKQSDGRIAIGDELLEAGEFSLLLEPTSKEGAEPLPGQDMLVMVDTRVTPELEQEGLARDLVRMVQQARKDAQLSITDRIALSLEGGQGVVTALVAWKDYIAEQTLAVSVADKAEAGLPHRFENEMDGEKVVIAFKVAA